MAAHRGRVLVVPPPGQQALDVQLRWEADAPLALTEAQQQWIDRCFAEAVADAEREGRVLFSDPTVRVIEGARWCALDRVEHAAITLRLGPTNYAEYWVSHKLRAGIPESLQPFPRAYPLPVCAVVRDAEGRLVLPRRSGSTAEGCGALHFCGGQIDPRVHQDAGGAPSFRAAMLKELEEELAIAPEEVRALTPIGFGYNPDNDKPEIMCLAQLSVPWTLARLDAAPDAGEHAEVLLLEDSLQTVADLGAGRYGEVTPPTLAAAWMHARFAFATAPPATLRAALDALLESPASA